jgi:hypothetical protein
MAGSGRVHDRAVLDALDAIEPVSFEGEVWRVTRKGRDALWGSSAHGRWSPGGEIEVLYTSLEREGALAEIGYRLALEPVWPSRLEHEIHAIEARTERALRFAGVASLEPLGVDAASYRSFDHAATQAIAAAAHFLEFARIPHLDPANTSKARGNAGETADSLFHPSRPSGPGHLIQRKALTLQPKLVHRAGRTAIHLGNPGSGRSTST